MTFLRGRPWLVPSLLAIFIGVMQLVTASDDSNPTFRVVIGSIIIVGGALMLGAAEHAHRKSRQAVRRAAADTGAPGYPPPGSGPAGPH